MKKICIYWNQVCVTLKESVSMATHELIFRVQVQKFS